MVFGGIDAGGTATKCLLLDAEGKILSRYEGPPANYQAGVETAANVIKATLRETMARAGLNRIVSLGIGIAGAGRKPELVKMEQILGRVAGVDQYALTDDGEIALLGAHHGQPGIVLVAGTGSIAYGLRQDGQRVRSGGWGAILGDEGSGYWIGLQAVRMAIRSEEGRSGETALSAAVRQKLGITSLAALPAMVYQSSLGRKEIAALAPVVFEYAQQGDPAATEIIDTALAELILLVKAVAEKMDFAVPKVAVVGGLFANPSFCEAFMWRLATFCRMKVVKPCYPPVFGGVIYGAERAGLPLTFL